jgi:hypothetical protein
LTSRVERQIEWRRSKVLELDSQGHTQTEIAQELQVSVGTVNSDLSYLREQAKYKIGKYIDEKLPHEYEKCLIGLNLIQREAWNTAQNTRDPREKIHALSLAKECYGMKLDLLTNATVVDDAIRFVAANANNKEMTVRTKAIGNYETEIDQENNMQPSNEMNDDLQEPHQEAGNDPSTRTTNQVF